MGKILLFKRNLGRNDNDFPNLAIVSAKKAEILTYCQHFGYFYVILCADFNVRLVYRSFTDPNTSVEEFRRGTHINYNK